MVLRLLCFCFYVLEKKIETGDGERRVKSIGRGMWGDKEKDDEEMDKVQYCSLSKLSILQGSNRISLVILAYKFQGEF